MANDRHQQQRSVIIPSNGAIDKTAIAEELADFEITEEMPEKKALMMEQFMNEPVQIELLDTDNPMADQIIEVFHNGVAQRFMRGVIVSCKRKFLYVLATARPTHISTPEIRDASGGTTQTIKAVKTLRYPYRVVADLNPLGRQFEAAWLQEA